MYGDKCYNLIKKGVLFKFFVELCWRKSRGRGQCLGEPIGGKANKKEVFVKRRVCFVRWAFEVLNLWVLSYVGSTRRFMNLSVRKNRMLYACTQKNLPCQESWARLRMKAALRLKMMRIKMAKSSSCVKLRPYSTCRRANNICGVAIKVLFWTTCNLC